MEHLRRDGQWQGELMHTTKAGRVLTVMARWSLEYWPDGSIKAVLESTEDITERKRAEEEIRASEHSYRLLFDKNPDGVFSVDAEGKFQMVNPACENISGYSKEELIGRHFSELCAPDQLSNTLNNFARVLREPGYSELETALLRKDGRRVELLIAGEPLMKHGTPFAVYCTAKDITQQKHFRHELERQVKEKTAALQETTDQLNSFVYVLAHDFKAPLRAQSGFAELLLDEFGEVLGQSGIECAQKISQAAQKQMELVNNLLKEITLGRESMPLGPVNLVRLVNQVLNDLALEIRLKKAVVRVGPLEGTVQGSAAWVHTVLTNLIANALKFVAKGVIPDITIWSEGRPAASSGEVIRFPAPKR